MFSSYVDVIFRLCSCAVFWVCARVCAEYIYIYIYIYGISDAPAPRSAPTFFLMRRLHFLCVWSFLNAIMPLYMQAIFFSLSISLIFPLCSPHIFYVLSGHSLDRPAPVIPIVSWLVISFTFPLPPLILPIYFQNVTCARSAPVTFFEVVLAPYFSLYCSDVLLFFLMIPIFVLDIVPTALSICLTFSIIVLQCSRTALGDCSSFSYSFHYYSLLTGD